LKDEALDLNLWSTGFGRNCGPVVRETLTWWWAKYKKVKQSRYRPAVAQRVPRS
jgi:hypothetical protein